MEFFITSGTVFVDRHDTSASPRLRVNPALSSQAQGRRHPKVVIPGEPATAKRRGEARDPPAHKSDFSVGPGPR